MKRRPVLVWLISVFYFATGIWYLPTLYNLAVVTFKNPAVVSSLLGPSELVAVIGLLAATILSFAAAYYLFFLRRVAVFIFGALFVLGIVYNLTEHYQDTEILSEIALLAILAVILIRAVLFVYVWKLAKKGILS